MRGLRRVSVSLALMALVAASMAVGASERGEARWVIRDLGTLGGDFSIASGVNDRGDVVGVSRIAGAEGKHVFVWRRGRMIHVGRWGWDLADWEMPKIGQGGHVTWYENGRGGVVWKDGVTRRLGPGFHPVAVNRQGWIVGYRQTPGCDPRRSSCRTRAALWVDGRLRELGASSYSAAWDVNDHGDVVGEKAGVVFEAPEWARAAFLWQNGRMRELGVLPGLTDRASCLARWINNRGQVLGGCSDENGSHPFLWEDGSMQDLEVTFAYALNERGQVLTQAAGTGGMWSLWQNGRTLDLGALGAMPVALNDRGQVLGWTFVWDDGVKTGLPVPGSTWKRRAYAINNTGQIVGWATTKSGRQHAVLWTTTGS